MKAVVLTKLGPPEVLQLQEVAKPSPKENEVLIKVHATTVTAGECEIRGLRVPLVLKLPLRIYVGRIRPKPIILGQELAGEIEAVGKAVTRLRKGDQITAWCGLRLSAYAEYACLRESAVMAIKPPAMTYEEAATLPIGGLDAAYLLRKGNIQKGERVLINGAGGSIGTYAVQIAKYFGAEVTAVDSARKHDMLRSIGADHVIDYTREDFTKSGKTYDVIFDVVGMSSFAGSVRSLMPNGRFLVGNSRPLQMRRARLAARGSNKQIIPWAGRSESEYKQDFDFLSELFESGHLKPVVDRCFPLEQTAEAHRYAESGHKKGNVVITVAHST